jgi:arsenate reductase (thioredoxin)
MPVVFCGMLPALQSTIQQLVTEFDSISNERKLLLQQLADFIQRQQKANRPALLNFICTHNSRRSHIAQLWAQAASYFYLITEVSCFSGGTEATAFNPRAVQAMQSAGFGIQVGQAGHNPVYHVTLAPNKPVMQVFSKKYDDADNPKQDFAAIMTCAHADEHCPWIVGAAARIGLTYDDPKEFDGTWQEKEKYAERVRQIGREMLFAFSLV